MTAWLRQSQAGQSLLALALGLVLAVRIMVPTGFMPAATAQGMVIQLCSGLAIDLPQSGGAPTSDKHASADRPCMFAAGLDHGGALVPASAAKAGQRVFAALPAAIRPIPPHVRHLAAPPPPSQAPPVLA
jgi:hypothetical protein